MYAELLILRIVHVLSGTFWVGSMLFTMIFLFPSLQEAGPAAGSVMAGFQKRKLMVVMPSAAFLTILSGFRLIWIISNGFSAAFMATTRGQVYSIAGGLFVNRPANQRMAALAQKLATAAPTEREALGAELARVRKRTGQVGVLVAVLVVVATIGMAVGRYV
jgi:uncharacterized membrane protein